jgi:hypothetical protein
LNISHKKVAKTVKMPPPERTNKIAINSTTQLPPAGFFVKTLRIQSRERHKFAHNVRHSAVAHPLTAKINFQKAIRSNGK